jgi:hypothetical protein
LSTITVTKNVELRLQLHSKKPAFAAKLRNEDAERPGRHSHAERGNEDAERPGRHSHAERGNENRGDFSFPRSAWECLPRRSASRGNENKNP